MPDHTLHAIDGTAPNVFRGEVDSLGEAQGRSPMTKQIGKSKPSCLPIMMQS